MEVQGSSKKMIATQAEMVEARVPISYRDQCAHLLIPLNKCRQSEFYLPWKCENERHSYEKCEYELVMERMLQMQKIREEETKLKKGIPLIPKTANVWRQSSIRFVSLSLSLMFLNIINDCIAFSIFTFASVSHDLCAIV